MNPRLKDLLLNRTAMIAALMVFLVLCFSVGLSQGIRGGISWLLSVIVVTGAVASFLLSMTRIRTWSAGILLVISGFSGITFYFTNLVEPLLQLINALVILRLEVITWVGTHSAFPDFLPAGLIIADLFERISVLFARVLDWYSGVQMGAVMNDPIARAFTWSLIAFYLSAWAGWMLGRYRNPLAAFTPMIAVLAIVADYSASGFTSLWLMFAGALILMGLTRYDVDRIRWQRTGVDFSESIPVDTGAAIVVLTVALAALAWIMPSISVKAMAETIRDWGKSQDELAESFGIQPAPAAPSNFALDIYPKGLPRGHLVGSGPELNRQFVMAIRTGELPPRPQISNPPPAPRHYWRSVTYDRFTGSGWLSSPVEVNTFKADQPLLESLPAGYREINQEITFLKDLGGQLHWTGALVSVNRPYQVAWRSDPTRLTQSDPFGGMDLLGALSSVDSYSAVSFEAAITQEQLRSSIAPYPASTARFLSLPDSTPERVLSLARELTAVETTPYDRALAIEAYLRENYPYTLDVPTPAPGRDVADYFLFDLKKGYCDYYATAMVVLARAAGLPARFVSGYASGTYDSDNAQYIVAEANAHSWVEIFFTDIGWVEFEPTAGLPPIDRLDQPSYLPSTIPAAGRTGGRSHSQFAEVLTGILIKVGLGLLILFLLTYAALWIESGWLSLFPSSISLAKIFRKMEKHGYSIAGGKSGETPYEFSARLRSRLAEIGKKKKPVSIFKRATIEIELITKLYVQSTFSQHPVERIPVVSVIHAWRRLRLRLMLAGLHSILDVEKGK